MPLLFEVVFFHLVRKWHLSLLLSKKDDRLDKKNYRPISILNVFSKIFERFLLNQIFLFLNKIQSVFLSAYRARYSCQHGLLRLIKGWRQCLDENKVAGAILMDLSKAFDCLPHDLLIAKLETYGIKKQSLLLLLSYLQQKKQSVKVKELSGFLQLIKSGVPQGSILGLILFNVFINDIYFSLQEDLHNFADDNTVSAIAASLQALPEVLTEKANTVIDLFQLNDMIVNQGKFKASLLQKNKRNTSEYPIVLAVHEIKTQEFVTF